MEALSLLLYFEKLCFVFGAGVYFKTNIHKSSVATIQKYDKTALFNDSEIIVIGEIKSKDKVKEGNWKETDGSSVKRKYQYVTVKIDKSLKKDIGSNVLVRVYPELGVDPDFKGGSKVMLFLKRDTDVYNTAKEDYYVLTGRAQGAFLQDAKNINIYNALVPHLEAIDSSTIESQLLEESKKTSNLLPAKTTNVFF